MLSTQWQHKQIIVIGAARQGLALSRFFLLHGASVILNDRNDECALEDAIAEMQAWQDQHQEKISGTLQWVLGGHPESILEDAALLCVSGGVPLELPIITTARERMIPITNDSELFMQSVPCQVIGITGSAGKTTTTALLGEILTDTLTSDTCTVWVGGNIGKPLIEHVEDMRPTDLVLLELSSFQLDLMETSPHISAVLNITPNHLDRHGTMEAYTHAKLNIFHSQTAQDFAIINHEDPGIWREREVIKSKLLIFGMQRSPLELAQTYLKDDQLVLFDGHQEHSLLNIKDIKLRGKHNILNVLAACAIAYAAGVPLMGLRNSVRHFKGVDHRLEFVRHVNGVSWFNDSIASAPERSMAAIRSFTEPLVVLLGGRDKNLPWDKLAKLIHRRVHDVILFGEAAGMIESILKQERCASSLLHLTKCTTLEEAVQKAAQIAQPGDVVVLSPGCTSFDEFTDFAERGERFKAWVQQIS
ncbi:MAG: UDP-N-acetylmuramoyl-L-alanine--D-glutamate ligase [Anaerolineae bacterium]|jgi:UDP-N-acetylmuramoylalanine--D-glutamate ligase|nr:UDP-N-acetylmuramoyl-L-alanine--D-glutamate ligase [Anaerolineae bacterium]